MRNKQLFPVSKKYDDKKGKWRKVPAIGKGVNWQSYQITQHELEHSKNLGAVIPEGVVVIDLDTYKGVSRSDIDSLISAPIDWDGAFIQRTVSGGEHYAFTIPMAIGIKQGDSLCGIEGFDTRCAGKGWICTGDGYTDMTLFGMPDALYDDPFPLLPSELIDVINGVGVVESFDEDDNDLLSMLSAQPLDITTEDVTLYMSKLTAEQADSDWLTVMFGLYHQTQGSSDGWKLFDSFSRLCADRYDEEQNRARWESCGRSSTSNPTTFASVIKLVGGRDVVESDKFEILLTSVKECATKEGLQGVICDVAAFKMSPINTTIMNKALIKQFKSVVGDSITVAELKRILKGAIVGKSSEFWDEYIFITITGEYMDRATKKTMGPRSFDVKHGRDTPSDQDGNPQTATNYVNSRIECVHDGMYGPTFDTTFEYGGVDYFNTYRPTELRRIENGTTDIVDRILGHIAHLLPDEREQQLVINYLAHNVQHSGKKLQWAMVLQGVQGDGKSFLSEMMKHVLGESNCRNVTVESLDEKYTSWAEGNCMVFIEELKLDNYKKYETLNKLKPYIVNPTVPIRRMQRDVYECVNTTNYFALTNYKDALPIDDNDRRYCVLFSQWQSSAKLKGWLLNNPAYYSKLYDDMRNHTGEILDYLLTHKIPSEFLALNRAPDTDAKRQMISIAKSDDFLIVEDAIEEFKCWDINEHVINLSKLQTLVSDSFESNYANFPKAARLKNIMLDMGFNNIGRYKSKGAVRRNYTIYCMDDKKKAADYAEEDFDFVPF